MTVMDFFMNQILVHAHLHFPGIKTIKGVCCFNYLLIFGNLAIKNFVIVPDIYRTVMFGRSCSVLIVFIYHYYKSCLAL